MENIVIVLIASYFKKFDGIGERNILYSVEHEVNSIEEAEEKMYNFKRSLKDNKATKILTQLHFVKTHADRDTL